MRIEESYQIDQCGGLLVRRAARDRIGSATEQSGRTSSSSVVVIITVTATGFSAYQQIFLHLLDYLTRKNVWENA